MSNGYLYAASSSNNYLKIQPSLTANSTWNITTEGETFVPVAQGTYTRNRLLFNPNNNDPIFGAYGTNSSGTFGVHIYEKVLSTVTAMTVTTPPTKTNYNVGQAFDTAGMVVQATYANSVVNNDYKNYTISPATFTTEGTQNVTITSNDTPAITTTVSVNVGPAIAASIAVNPTSTHQTSFVYNSTFVHTGLKIDHTDNLGVVTTLETGFTVSSVDTTILGNQTVTVTHTDTSLTTTYVVNVTNIGYTVPSAMPLDLYISEYLEGSSNNKAIEIYNGTGAAVDLASYQIQLFSNGATTANQTLSTTSNTTTNNAQLPATIASGATIVVYHGQANDAIKAVGNVVHTNTMGFNGDDAVALLKNDVVIDVIGTIGTDPGTEFTGTDANGQPLSTLNKTLVRVPSLTGPNATWTPSEWITHAVDTVSYLGAHTSNNGGSVDHGPQALAYANYFLDMTRPFCLDNSKTLDWTSLKNEYEAMAAAVRDYFFASTNSQIVDARARYQVLRNVHPTLTTPNFMVDGTGNPLGTNKGPVVEPATVATSTRTIAIITIIGLSAIGGYYALVKKKGVNSNR